MEDRFGTEEAWSLALGKQHRGTDWPRAASLALILGSACVAVAGGETKAFGQTSPNGAPAPSPQRPSENQTAQDTGPLRGSGPDPSGETPDLSLEELLNVDVTTVSKFAEKQADAPGIISVLSADDLKRFGGMTLKDILNRVPGLNASSGYLTDRSTIAARGDQVRFNSGHVLVLLNGRPVREVMEGGLSSDMFERFPVASIEKIEVIKGPGSVLYGSDAFSAVINIITKRVQATSATVGGVVGTDGNSAAYSPSGTATLNFGDLSVLLTANYLQQPQWQQDYLFRNTPTSPIVALPINGPDKGGGAFLDANYKELRLMAAYANWDYWYQLKGIINNGIWSKAFVNLGYSHKITEIWKTDLNVGLTNSQLNFTHNRPFVQRDSNELVAEWTNFVEIARNAKIVVGALFDSRSGIEKNNAVSPTVDTNDARQLGFQSYAQMDYTPVRQVKLIGGIQANKVGDLDWDAEPRLGIILSPTSRLSLKGLYSTAYRAPAIDELFLQDVNLHGTPTLKPEKVSAFDFGVTYQGAQVQLGASYFNGKQTDIIRPVVAPGATGTNALQLYENTSGVLIQGGEVEGKVYINKYVYLTASALYQRSKNDQGITDVTPIPAFSAKGGLSYLSDNGVNASIFDIFSGDILGSEFTQGKLNPAPQSYNDIRVRGTFDLNRMFSWRFQPDITLLLQVTNLLDIKYYIPEWGGTVHDSIPGTVGRTIYGGASLTL